MELVIVVETVGARTVLSSALRECSLQFSDTLPRRVVNSRSRSNCWSVRKMTNFFPYTYFFVRYSYLLLRSALFCFSFGYTDHTKLIKSRTNARSPDIFNDSSNSHLRDIDESICFFLRLLPRYRQQ